MRKNHGHEGLVYLTEPSRGRTAQQNPFHRLYAPHQHQDQHDDENQTETAAGIITPSATVWPCRQGADEKQD
jgi:hypothetical protein